MRVGVSRDPTKAGNQQALLRLDRLAVVDGWPRAYYGHSPVVQAPPDDPGVHRGDGLAICWGGGGAAQGRMLDGVPDPAILIVHDREHPTRSLQGTIERLREEGREVMVSGARDRAVVFDLEGDFFLVEKIEPDPGESASEE